MALRKEDSVDTFFTCLNCYSPGCCSAQWFIDWERIDTFVHSNLCISLTMSSGGGEKSNFCEDNSHIHREPRNSLDGN